MSFNIENPYYEFIDNTNEPEIVKIIKTMDCTVVIIIAFIIIISLILLYLWLKNRQAKTPKEFVITYLPKNRHPWKRIGSTMGFSINGIEGPNLELKRGVPYMFTYASPNPSLHPFYFTTSDIGGVGDDHRISGSPEIDSLGSKVIVFDKHYPNTFYYQSALEPKMGGMIHLS